jgi:hypothetical protein
MIMEFKDGYMKVNYPERIDATIAELVNLYFLPALFFLLSSITKSFFPLPSFYLLAKPKGFLPSLF